MKQIKGIWFPDYDTHFEKIVDKQGNYQKDTFDYAMSYVKEPKIFYDIGAHVGLWSLMAHRAGFKVIKAYEPNDEVFSCLIRNTFDQDNIEAQPIGISQFDGERRIIKEDEGNSGAVRLQISVSADVVPCATLNNHSYLHSMISEHAIKPHETLVKIDTEGMEAECVLGMDKIIYALRPVVCVEQKSNKDALDILQKMGMEIVKIIRKDYILTWKNQ